MALQRFRKEFGRSPTQEERKEISEDQDPLDWTLRQPPNNPRVPDHDQEVRASKQALTDAKNRAKAANLDEREFEAARIARQKSRSSQGT